MNIQYKKLSDITPYEKNPRKNDSAVEYVANSIKEFGFKVPIIIDKDGVIIAGHTRYKAAIKLKMKEVPCITADDLSEEQIKAFRLADNKVAEKAEWDFDLLGEELEDILNIDMSDFGFDFDIETLQQNTVTVEDDDFIVDIPEEPKTKKGDVYLLGRHKLMCGDSTNISDFEKLMGNDIADITFTSPPYNAGTTPSELKAKKDTKYSGNNDSRSQLEYLEFLNAYLHNTLIYSQYSFMNIQSIAGNKIALIDLLYDNKEVYADTIIWDKMLSQPAMAENVLNSEFEYIHVFSHKANRAIGTKKFRGTLSNIVHIHKQTKNEFSEIHNATFSMEFAEFFIKNFSTHSVLEPFAGTGTTIISCEQLGRNCYAMEYEPKYCDVIIQRWEKFTGNKAILL